MARRKITEGDGLDASQLPELTAQQMGFVRGILDGKSASDAYRQAYDCSEMQNNSIWVAASRLRSDANVALWLAASRKACLGTANVTLDGHLQELERLKEIALDTGNVGAAVQAEQLRGKAAGHYVERFEDITKADPLTTLEQIRQHSPELARALAAEHGIALTEH